MDRKSDLTLDAILARYENPGEVLRPHYKDWIESRYKSSTLPGFNELRLIEGNGIIAEIMRTGIDETPEFVQKLIPWHRNHHECEDDWRVYQELTGKIHPDEIEYDPYSFAFGDNTTCDCCGKTLNPLNRSPMGYLCRECDDDNIARSADEQDYDDEATLPSQVAPSWM